MSLERGLVDLCARFRDEPEVATLLMAIGCELIVRVDRGEVGPNDVVVTTRDLGDGRQVAVSLTRDGDWEALLVDAGGIAKSVKVFSASARGPGKEPS